MDNVIEEVTVHSGGKTAVFEILDTPAGQRAYVKGSSMYYDMDTFSKGLKKADKVSRKQIADLFECPPSQVRL